MKGILVAVFMCLSLTACKSVVERNDIYEQATVTKFNKVSKHQRISFVTAGGKVYNDFYVSKRCSGCSIQVGETINIKRANIKWDDGTEETYIYPSYIKSQLN